jgi:hypothetical protein
MGLLGAVLSMVPSSAVVVGVAAAAQSQVVYVVIVVCAGVFALGVGVVVAVGAWRERTTEIRRAAGQCLGCGYDLRESIDQCPECGRPFVAPPPLAQLAPPWSGDIHP